MTGVSSLGSSTSQYISSLDKNGDGIISADELAAASTSSTSTTKSSTANSSADSASVTQKIAADILSLMLQIKQSSTADDSSDDSSQDSSGDTSSSKGILGALDADGDGKLTSDEILSADPSKVAESTGDGDSSVLAQVLTDMQTAIRAYQTTYGSSMAADTSGDETQTA